MSTDETDTTFSADGAETSPEATELGKDTPNGKTVEVTEAELEDLGKLLSRFHTVLLGHEHRLLEHEGRITTLEHKKPVKLEIPRGRSR